ncbi:MAG: ABC transporter ATP-binding protein [Bacteroidota bacterium]
MNIKSEHIDHILEIENLTIDFQNKDRRTRAIEGVEFSLKRNQILGIVGESGSGKSVTSMAILKLLSATQSKVVSGRILFQDGAETIDLLKLNSSEIRKYRGNRISMIFQEPMTSLNPSMKCGKQVAEVLQTHRKISSKEARAEVITLFNEVMLPRSEKIFESYPHEISGGQKQRVMIAMAIACKPDILIADEPTTALDVTVQHAILMLLKSLRDKYKMSIIFITHDLGVVAEIADDVLVMYKGKVVEKGSTDQVFHNPQHPYTKGLLYCRPPLNFRYQKLPTVSEFLENETSATEIINTHKIITSAERNIRLENLYHQEPLLKITNLEKQFEIKSGSWFVKPTILKAVNNVSFDVYKGETVGLVGESGCGKTTLGRTLLQLVRPSNGSVFYKGKDLAKMSKSDLKHIRKEIQIIFQDPYSSLNPRIAIGEAIVEPMRVHGIEANEKAREEKAKYILERVGLPSSHFQRYPHEFSGGQRQRVCIARALALNPELIICDESVSALDVSVQAQVLNLLNELKEEFGFTYIFISHDLSVVHFMSDRIVVMKDGMIQEISDADELYNHPKTDYTRNLIDAIPGRV